MSAGHSVSGSVYCSGSWVRGRVEYRDGIISRVVGIDIVGDPEPPYIIPGFIDLHVHGGGGADVMGGASELATMCEYHASNGTVALCATTVTAPLADIDHALSGAREYMDAPVPGAAEVLGVHLEGPFINPARLGGQPPFAIPPRIELLAGWKDIAPVRIVTLAPELRRTSSERSRCASRSTMATGALWKP
ncbi:N-acetylglucosamine-6-phosphate deacetylase [Sphingomonas sp. OK281]|nr:N-acetylglucosamine-6-phosphate deacetylase [Sphingomonas sp. OK281]